MKNPLWLDTTAWAIGQERVIKKERPPEYLGQWEPLYLTQMAVNGVTNLTARQNFLLGYWKEGEHQYRELLTGGSYHIEGPDYHDYTAGAMGNNLPDIIKYINSEYLLLQAPDLTIPVPEASDRKFEEHKFLPDDLWREKYVVRRWRHPETGRVIGYVLVCTKTEFDHRRNLHVHPEAGHLVVWAHGKWVLPPYRYIKFNIADAMNDTSHLHLPKGAVVPVKWRFDRKNPVKVSSLNDVHVNFGGFFAPKRTIRFHSDKLVIHDKWSWRNDEIVTINMRP